MNKKLYQLFCNHCAFRLITDGSNIDLAEHKTAAIQITIPDIDPETGIKKEIKFRELPRRFKCPKCGFIIKSKEIENPQQKIEEDNSLKERVAHRIAREKEQDRLEKEKDENRLNGNQTSTE
jgi:rubredoxin